MAIEGDTHRLDVTLADVAAEVGLHPSTVSRALDPAKASMVKEPTRQRILEAAERVGYRPNLSARALTTGRTSSIAVIAADLGNLWVTPIIHGIASRLSVDGTVPIIGETGDDSRVLAELVDHMFARRVDAMIVLAARREDTPVIESAGRIVPTVVAARPLFDVSVPVVRASSRLGGRLVAGHFAELGHRHVAQLRGPRDVLNFERRAEGFSNAALEAGLTETRMEAEAEYPKLEDGMALAESLLGRTGEMPTAVFAHNDWLAAGALAVFKRRGLRVPEDISLAGYNGMPLTDQLSPSLTTVRYPGWEVGHLAAETALAMVGGETEVAPHLIDPELLVRASTAPPPS